MLIVLPWVGGRIKSLSVGGMKVDLDGLEEADAKIQRGLQSVEWEHYIARPSWMVLADQDPNVALVALRIEIEKRLRALSREGRT